MQHLASLCEQTKTHTNPARIRNEISNHIGELKTSGHDLKELWNVLYPSLCETEYGFSFDILSKFIYVVHPDTIIKFQGYCRPMLHLIIIQTTIPLKLYLFLWPDVTPDLKDQYKRTALHLCTWNVSIQDPAFVSNLKLLLEYGFDPMILWNKQTVVDKIDRVLQRMLDSETISEDHIQNISNLKEYMQLIIKRKKAIKSGLKNCRKNGDLQEISIFVILKMLGYHWKIKFQNSKLIKNTEETAKIISPSSPVLVQENLIPMKRRA